jgi:PEP-CTERM motif
LLKSVIGIEKTMKRSKLNTLRNASLIAVGLVLARGAQATTTIGSTTLTLDPSAGAPITTFGSLASTSSPGVVTTLGGTPDVSLVWQSTLVGHTAVNFDYISGGPWSGDAELNNSSIGITHEIDFSVPSFASVTLNSFNFQPYLADGNGYTYTVTVFDVTKSTVLDTQGVTIPATSTLKDLVTLNAVGGLGDTLALTLTRTGGTGNPLNIAIDDPSFTELVPEPTTAGLLVMGLGAVGALAVVKRKKA